MNEMKMKSNEEVDYAGGSPLDSIISRLDSYIKNPKLVTPETLSALKSELEDLQPILDGDDREGMEEAPVEEEPKEGGISIMIGKMKKAKKGLMIAACLLLGGAAHAFDGVPASSYTSVESPTPIIFSSMTIRFLGAHVSSAAANGYLVIYRSTSPTFNPSLSTQTIIPMYSQTQSFPLYDITNTSYTFIHKVGLGQATLFYRCIENKSGSGVCPGLK